MKRPNVDIRGITGAVGEEILGLLHTRDFPITRLRLLASEKTAAKKQHKNTKWGKILIEDANKVDYSDTDISFFAIGSSWSKENAQKATDAGCYVIDNSSCFRYEKEVPLIIPGINSDAIGDSKLIANPNCTTAIAAFPLRALHQAVGLEYVIISTYQATSGAGREAMTELVDQTEKYLEPERAKENIVKNTRNYVQGINYENKEFVHPIAFNLIPHIDTFMENGYTKEEMKTLWETQKIFGDANIPVDSGCVRVPTFRVHAEDITAKTKKPITADEARELFKQTAGLEVVDDPSKLLYPMPYTATGKDDVEVGRIRQSIALGDKGIRFFVAGDQLLRGAALNAVEIAELVVDKHYK